MDRIGSTNPKAIVASYFCGDESENRRTSIWILRSLIHQACTQNLNLLKHLRRWYQQPGSNDTEPHIVDSDVINPEDVFGSYEQLCEILIAIATDPDDKGIYFVIDGLDYCGHPAYDFLHLVKGNNAAALLSNANVHCIISSRPSDFIQRQLETSNLIELAKENRSDITAVIEARMERLQDCKNFSDNLRCKIQDLLVERSDGMFLWVCLALDQLDQRKGIWNENTIESFLRNMPSTLDDAYNEILTKIDAQSDDEATSGLRKMLMWTYFASRDLKLDELQLIWFLQPGDKSESKIKERFLDPEEFRKVVSDLCGGLLIIQTDDTIKPCHQSVKDFLSHLYNSSGQTSKFAMTPGEAHAQMAGVCITYLSLKDISQHMVLELPLGEDGLIDTSKREEVIRGYLENHNFLEYSIMYLGDHLRALKESNNSIITDFKDFFGDRSVPLVNWVNAYDLMKRWTHGKCKALCSREIRATRIL